MVRVRSGGKAYLVMLVWFQSVKSIGTYHERKATKKPDQEKKNVRPYLFNGLRIG